MGDNFLLKILKKISDHTAADEDLAIYNDWCNAMQSHDNINEGDETEDAKIKTFNSIYKHINIYRLIKKKKKNFMAAASIMTVIILTSSLFVYVRYTKINLESLQRRTVLHSANETISVGKNAGTLTFSDGRKIVLKNISPGKIMKQHGVVISKTSDNKLIYRLENDSQNVGIKYNTLTTAAGEQYNIILSDGTEIYLNAASYLRFPSSFIGLTKREVELSGEAYFNVKHNSQQPFFVKTSKQYIEDIGTHFNISAYPEDSLTKTTLLEGCVKINNEKILKPGQQAASSQTGNIKVSEVNIDAAVAWKNGYFEFDGENIYEIMKRIARWYNVEVIYEGNMPLSGMQGTLSRYSNIADILDIIHQTGIFSFKVVNKYVYVSVNIR